MPLFRKSESSASKSKQEQKMCIAKETPEPIFDLNDCGMNQVPPGVYSMCRVFRKEELLLSRNNLTTLKGGGNLQDLSNIKVLDLSFNKIVSLPEDIGCLEELVILNLCNNQLKKLPKSMWDLSKLEHLNLSQNLLKELPDFIGQLKMLNSLFLDGNRNLKKLPTSLSQLNKLCQLKIDEENMIFPSAEICKEGIESILRFMCSEQSLNYIPPTLDSLSPSSQAASVSSLNSSETSPVTPGPPDTFLLHQLAKERRMKELLDMEESLRRHEQNQFELGQENILRRQKLLTDCREDQERMEGKMQILQAQKDERKSQLLLALNNLEKHSALLISDLLALNERTRSSDAIAAAMERDRLEAEELFAIKQEELEDARKNDILASMKEILAAEEKQRAYGAKKLAESHKNNENPSVKEILLLGFLNTRENDQQMLFKQLLEEENLQRQAYHALQVQRDFQHSGLTQQIWLIERELAKLTEAEIKRKELKSSQHLSLVEEQRSSLANLLVSLLKQRDLREELLVERLREMEECRAEEIKDYWFIQYKKLLDRKPQEVLDMELVMDPSIRQVLSETGTDYYKPLFATAQVTIEQLAVMSPEDLSSMGVTDTRVQGAILNAAKYMIVYAGERNVCKRSPEEGTTDPSAPLASPCAPTAPLLEEGVEIQSVQMWHQPECVVCMDKESTIVFLPCGHVCTCLGCAKPLELCPLCRIKVNNKLSLGAN